MSRTIAPLSAPAIMPAAQSPAVKVRHAYGVRAHWIQVKEGAAEGDASCEAGHRIPLPDGEVDGIYAGWTWDGSALSVQQDRYGFFPLFESRWAGARHLSTDLVTLLERGAPTTLDYDALSVFVRVGFFVGADTPFQSIRAVLPPCLPRRRQNIARTAAVDGFVDLCRQAMRRRLPSAPFEMPLSGGRDSRHILFELCDAGRAPQACVTVRHFPPRANDDELIARELCQVLGIEHRVIDQPHDRAAVERRKNAATHLCTDEHAQFVVLADHLQAHTRETYDGIAGDVLSQSTYLRPEVHALYTRGDFAGVAAFVLDGYGTTMTERALEKVLAPDFYREVPRERALVRLQAEVARHADAANPIGSFFLHNRTRREIALAPFALMRGITAYAPYLDRDLFDLLSSLPAELLMDRSLHTDAIARAWPQHANLPYERKGLKVQDRAAQRRLAASLAAAVLRPATRPFLRRAPLLAPLAATLLDGAAGRSWHAPLVLYLDQIAAVRER
jgi:asparagine synthase (glutamine-hydrolysing)